MYPKPSESCAAPATKQESLQRQTSGAVRRCPSAPANGCLVAKLCGRGQGTASGLSKPAAQEKCCMDFAVTRGHVVGNENWNS